MRLRTKMFLLPAVTVAAFVAVEALSARVASEGDRLLARIDARHVPELLIVHDLGARLAQLQQALQDAVAARDPRAVRATAGLRDAILQRVGELGALPEADGKAVDALAQSFRAYHGVAAASAGELASGKASSADVEVLVAYDELHQDLQAMEERARVDLSDALAGAADAQRAGRRAISVSIGVAALLVAALAAWIFTGVVRPLSQLGRAASRIATQGDLTQQVTVAGDDELAQLAQSFRDMVEKLREVPRAIAASVTGVSGAVRAVGGASSAQASALQRQAQTLAFARRVAARVRSAGADAGGRAEQVLAVAGDAEEFVERGQREARSGLQALSAMRDEVRTAVREVGRLDNHVERAALHLDAVRQAAAAASELCTGLAVELARSPEAGELATQASKLRGVLAGAAQGAARAHGILTEARRLAGGVAGVKHDEGRIDQAFAQLEAAGNVLRELLRRLQRTGRAAREIVEAVAGQEKGLEEVNGAIAEAGVTMDEVLRQVAETQTAIQTLEQDADRLAEVVASFRL
jgi:methyl-accepting chemotaxis protein